MTKHFITSKLLITLNLFLALLVEFSNVYSSAPPDSTKSKDTIQMDGPKISQRNCTGIESATKSKKNACKRGRPRKLTNLGLPCKKVRRDAANARERRRMNQLTDAYMALKDALPVKDEIKSKKQIIVQVW